MAIAIAREGGVRIIHRFMTLEDQVSQVSKVKRNESIIIESPYTLRESASVFEVRQLMSERNVGGILIVSKNGSSRELCLSKIVDFSDETNSKVSEIMTKRSDLVVTPRKTSPEKAKEIMRDTKIEKLPLVDREDRLVGLITAKDILKRKQFPIASKDSKGRLRVGAAIGVKGDFLKEQKGCRRLEQMFSSWISHTGTANMRLKQSRISRNPWPRGETNHRQCCNRARCN